MTETGIEQSESHSTVLVGGFGVIGRTCVERLEETGVLCTIIEMNPTTVREQTAKGRRAVFGDISNPEVLESAGIEQAEAVLLTLPDSDATMRAIRTIRGLYPEVHIAVRVSMQPRAEIAQRLGANMIVVEETVAATVLSEHVIEFCKLEESVIIGDDDGVDPDSPTIIPNSPKAGQRSEPSPD